MNTVTESLMNTAVPFAATMVLTALSVKIGIPILHRLKFGQHEREEGIASHKVKAGTPTMAGLFFIPVFAIIGIILAILESDPAIVAVLIATVGFGIVGFIDDFLMIVKKQNEGFKPKQKLIAQFVLCIAFILYLVLVLDYDTTMIIPFTSCTLDLGWAWYPFVIIVLLGTDNGANLTDGVDGLATSVTIPMALFFGIAGIILDVPIVAISFAFAGMLMGFLFFNAHKAAAFMGDTGSLALGGFVASAALLLKMPLIIVIVAIIYLMESISVILQVAVYKKTKKRIFRCAPIHHHFEMGGWNETKVVIVFFVITVLACALGTAGVMLAA